MLPFVLGGNAEAAAIQVKPYRVEIAREGTVIVKLRATVTGRQALYFTAPTAFFSTAVASLTAKDSRGGSPLIYIPSPPPKKYSQPKNVSLAWLSNNAGKHVEIRRQCNSTPLSGRLLGLYAPNDGGDDSTHPLKVFLENNGQVVMSLADDIERISIATDTRPASFELPGCDALAGDIGVPVVVVADGVGVGEVNIAYETAVRQYPPFEFQYKTHVQESVLDGRKNPSAIVKASVSVVNPFHLDLEDVEVCLTVHENERHPTLPDFNYIVEKSRDNYKDSDSEDSDTQNSEDSDSENDLDDVAFPFRSRRDRLSVMPLTPAESSVTFGMPRFVEEISERVTIERGGSAQIQLEDFVVSMRTYQYINSDYCLDAQSQLEIENISDRTMQAGNLEYSVGKSKVSCHYHVGVVAPGEHEYVPLSYATVSVEKSSFKRAGNEVVCNVHGQELVTRHEWTKTNRMELRNQSSSHVSIVVVVKAEPRESGCVTNGMLFENVDDMKLSDGEKIEPRVERKIWNYFEFEMQGKQRKVFVVRQTLHAERYLDMVRDCNECVISDLEEGGSDTSVIAKLREIFSKKREWKSVKRAIGYLDRGIEETEKSMKEICKKDIVFTQRSGGGNTEEGEVVTVERELEKYMLEISRGNEAISEMEKQRNKAQMELEDCVVGLRALRDEIIEIVSNGGSKGVKEARCKLNGNGDT